MALWVTVNGTVNGEALDDTILNRGLYQLTERTNYLYGRIQAMAGSGLFESVRVTDVALVATGPAIPSVGNFVYLEEISGKYAKAIASPSTLDVFTAGNSAYAIGLLVAKSGDIGTVALLGKVPLVTGTSGWDLSTMVETGETFRNGPYYMSSTEAGKMTATTHGPAIYLGYFMEDPANPGYGGYTMMGPQYKDMKEAHAHRAYALAPQCAGKHEVTGTGPADTHSILGFDPVTPEAGGDHTPLIVATGTWQGTAETQYNIWLSNSSSVGEVVGTSSPPTSWANCYIHWNSDDILEPAGVARIWSFENLISIGTKGLFVNLENTLTTDWDDPYTVAVDSPYKRMWIIDAPVQIKGWLARKYRQYFSDYPLVDRKFSFILMGGPHSSTDDRIWDVLTVKCAKIYTLDYTLIPLAGSAVVVAGTTFTFGTTVPIVSGDIPQTMQNLVDVVLAAALPGVDVALDSADSKVVFGVPAAAAVSTTVAGASVTLRSAGAGSLSTGTSSLLVYDKEHKALVGTTGYWDASTYWTPVTLTNGLQIMAIPYDVDGSAATSNATAVGDYWNVQIADEAPGANFVYSIGMDQSLYKFYPPIPVDTGIITNNGIEASGYSLFPDNPEYRLSLNTIYWYSDLYDQVPWPKDWVSIANPGTELEDVGLFFGQMSIGNTGIVTSLQPAPNSPIRVLQCGTNESGTVGDLALDVDLNLVTEDANLSGYQTIKLASGNRLRRGPIVERLIAGPGISISSSAGAPAGQGVVTVTSTDSALSGEFETVALENAKQEKIGMFPYIKLLGWTNGGSNINTGFVAKFRIPHTMGYGVPEANVPKYKVVVYMTVFGETTVAGGSPLYAGIDFEYSILPDFFTVSYDDSSDPTASPAWNVLDETLPEGLLSMTTPIHADIPFGKTGASPVYKAYDPMLIHNNDAEDYADEERRIARVLGIPFPTAAELAGWGAQPAAEAVVKPGSIVGIRVRRANSTTGGEYTGALGFINIRYRLISV